MCSGSARLGVAPAKAVASVEPLSDKHMQDDLSCGSSDRLTLCVDTWSVADPLVHSGSIALLASWQRALNSVRKNLLVLVEELTSFC